MGNAKADTAGRHDPFWYENFVGLMEVVELLDPDSGVASVTFQSEGVKGWDDVIVQFKSGRRRCYQVKHTRKKDRLTFGDLVQPDEKSTSLLGALFGSWKSAGLNDGLTECVLYTNREAGSREATSAAGVRRPPLLKFMKWLIGELPHAQSLADCKPKAEWAGAWGEWKSQLASGSDQEQIEFLRALKIRVDQDDLDGLSDRVCEKLAATFGVSPQRTNPVFDSLHRALKKWTTGYAAVTVEELCAQLALEAEPSQLALAPPPPAPFFPSRVPVAAELESDLNKEDAEPVFFVTAEPGAGKTSLLSWLSNRKTDRPFTGIVGIRFFCFEPIRPESPFVAPDDSRVQAQDLWFSLLTQLREGFRRGRRLHELQIPIRNEFLTWPEARKHVLRIASRLGKECGKHFVILIDGIDHAARSAQTTPAQAAEFFSSLPGPDELKGKSIRLLVAGQPSDLYSNHYPVWLQGQHSFVRHIKLPKLHYDDLQTLYRERPGKLPLNLQDNVTRLIETFAKGNTLASVFAVAEAWEAESLEALAQRLMDRHLADGLSEYYQSIWKHTLVSAGDFASDVDCCLVGAISLARQGVSPEFLAATFQEWNLPAAWWRIRLESLGPLLTEGTDGFRVRHNDVRIFLSGRFAGFPPPRRQKVISQLVDYYLKPDSDRTAAHIQLFDLLKLAERQVEASRIFTVDWVREAAAVGIDYRQLRAESELAIRGLSQLRDWRLVVGVACASQTLERFNEVLEEGASDLPTIDSPLPPFLPSEAMPRPTSQWSIEDFSILMSDSMELVQANEEQRAIGLLQRWLSGLSLSQIMEMLPRESNDFQRLPQIDPDKLDHGLKFAFERLGWLCGKLKRAVSVGQADSTHLEQAEFLFEKGYVEAAVEDTSVTSLDELFAVHEPRFIASWESAISELAGKARWPLVREMLNVVADIRSQLSSAFQANATWWALKSSASVDDANWLLPLSDVSFRLNIENHGPSQRRIEPILNMARANGWHRLDHDPGDTADVVFRVLDPYDQRTEVSNPTLLILRTAAMLGRIDRVLTEQGNSGVRVLVRPDSVGAICAALWGDPIRRSPHFQHRNLAGQLALELVEFAILIGGEFQAVVYETALPFAQEFPFNHSRIGLWRIVSHCGNHELLRKWVRRWIAADGRSWRESHSECRESVQVMSQLAKELGLDDLARIAKDRTRWRIIGYRGHKEYELGRTLDWFREVARIDPTLWRDHGWRYWTLCDECASQGGDNRADWDVRKAICSAALKCGANEWWTLISAMHEQQHSEGWHERTRSQFVGGAIEALRQGWTPSEMDLPVIWSIGVTLSFWTDAEDNSGLRSFRKELLAKSSQADHSPMVEFLNRTSRAVSLEFAASSTRDNQENVPAESKTETNRGIEGILERLHQGDSILPSEAAFVIERLSQYDFDSERDLRPKALQSIGKGNDYGTDWALIDRDVPKSLDSIVRAITDDEFWNLVGSLTRSLNDKDSMWVYGIHRNLLHLALARAKVRGLDELKEGLNQQLQMHACWAFGLGPTEAVKWPKLPSTDSTMSWRDASVKLLGVLLKSRSSEVLLAAIEGMHSLVATDESLIPKLFAELTDEWQRHWLLNAAESWASLHSDALALVHSQIGEILQNGMLTDRLQAWIVLCRLADSRQDARPPFPLPTTLPKTQEFDSVPGLLFVPATRYGYSGLINGYSAAASLLRHLNACGFDFSDLQSQIARGLQEVRANDSASERKGPHRYAATFCTEFDVETAVSNAILTVLSKASCKQNAIPFLAQGFLGNEEAWLQRSPPLRSTRVEEWPPDDTYSASNRLSHSELKSQMQQIALEFDVIPGWQTLAARVFHCSHEDDFVFRLWWEQKPAHLSIRATHVPTCPSGRSFLWWLGDFTEPESERHRFVSAFFAGGRQRLHHCHFEIQPALAWRDFLGWEQDRLDPTIWTLNGKIIARYERFHGPLRENTHAPKHRQPVVDRWVVSKEAFQQVEAAVDGGICMRCDFESYQFKH